jgi:hypothetical protein
VKLDYACAERLAATALDEPSRHLAIRFLSEALEIDPDEQSGLRNKGLLASFIAGRAKNLGGGPCQASRDSTAARPKPSGSPARVRVARVLSGYHRRVRTFRRVCRYTAGGLVSGRQARR